VRKQASEQAVRKTGGDKKTLKGIICPAYLCFPPEHCEVGWGLESDEGERKERSGGYREKQAKTN